MKQQVLNHKNILVIFTLLLFVYGMNGIADAGLEFSEGETTTREIAENTSVDTNIGASLRYTVEGVSSCVRTTLRGPDARAFTAKSVFRGVQLTTKSALDYETKDSYEVRVIISASAGGNREAITVNISVTDVNEAPMFSESDVQSNRIFRSIPENTVAGTNIGEPISAIDPDGAEIPLEYSLNGTNASMFEIDSGMGQLKTKVLADYEAFDDEPRAYFVNVQASDGKMSTDTEVRIEVEPVNEFAPMFIHGDSTTRDIHEKEELGASVGEPISAKDMDIGETLVYSISDANNDSFKIDSSTGQLRTIALLDYQTKPAYTLKVLVSDGSKEDSIIVTIQVLTDVVNIPDASLARRIRRTLGISRKDDITKKAMSELTTLNANRSLPEIDSITGLEHATNLTSLNLFHNSINDITSISGLTNLTTLNIEANRVDRIGPLSGLTNLTSLHLSDNRVGNLEPLSDLTNLTELLLDFNRIDDLTPLSGLTNLRILHLRFNERLKDVSPLSKLVNLEVLKLEGCPITDFTPLKGLTADIDVLEASAPSANRTTSQVESSTLQTSKNVLHQRLQSDSEDVLKYRNSRIMLKRVLAQMQPKKTLLLANYPNPFNPETWIPYHLAKASQVEITIFNLRGTAVRHLDLGHQQAGYHTNRSQAAYWDGKNDDGKRVASGPYFYQFYAANVSQMRKMVILK